VTSPSREALSPQLVYIESSALVAALFEQDARSQAIISAATRLVSSALTFAEANRALIRARLAGRLTSAQEQLAVRGLATFARRCAIIAVSDDVLRRASRPFPREPVRTLDAIHLASVELLEEPPPLVTVLTRDSRVRANAESMGFALA
jgi:predicted nucleic acid-binding protein